MPVSIEQRDQELLDSEPRVLKHKKYFFWLLFISFGLVLAAVVLMVYRGGFMEARGEFWMAIAITMMVFMNYAGCGYSLRHIESIKHYQNRLTQTSPK